MDHVEYCRALEIEVARFSEVMASLSRDQAVPTCPGWTVVDLAEHLGVIHRWAEELVRRRSPERLARQSSLENREHITPEWIDEGGRRLVATLLRADPDDAMWSWGADQHVRFWSRRQLHETLVHRMDLELATGRGPMVDATIAIDAIDEYLSNLHAVSERSPGTALRGRNETLGFRVRGSRTLWSITLGEAGFSMSSDERDFDAELVGAPVDLLLALLGRRTVETSDVNVIGERQLVDFWLAHSAFD